MTELLKVYWMIFEFMMMLFPLLIFYNFTETERDLEIVPNFDIPLSGGW